MAEADPKGTDRPEGMESQMAGLYWWGPGTLFGCPLVPDARGVDIALVGLPHSGGNGTTERDQHLGPRAVRNVSSYYRRTHRTFGIDPWREWTIRDVGDSPIPHMLDNDLAIEEMEQFLSGSVIAHGARPVSVGGDHSVTLAILRALTKPPAVDRGISLLHLDAHLDTYEARADWYGVRCSAAHWAAIAVHEGAVDPGRSVQLGKRGHLGAYAGGHLPDLGYRVVDKDEFDQLGVQATVNLIRDRVGDNPLYISVDLDVLDPSIAPAVANPEAGEDGMTMNDVVGVLRGLRGINVVGGDVACLVPTKDTANNLTSLRASGIMFEQICLVAEALKSRKAP